MKKNTLTYLIIPLSLAFAGAAVGLIITSQPNLALKILPKQLSPSTKAEKTLSQFLDSKPAQLSEYDEIAAKTLACMDEKLKDDNGIFFGIVTCNNNNKCDQVRSNRSTHPVVWAKFNYFAKHYDLSYLESAIVDAESLRREIQSIQNVFWNAKLSLENKSHIDDLLRYQLISETEYAKLTDNLYNYRNVYYNQEIPEKYVDITPEAPIKISAEKLRQDLNNPDYQDKYVLERDNFFYLDYLPSEYVARFQLFNDAQELKKANFFYSQGLELIKKQKKEAPAKSVCMLGEASLDYYQLTDDTRYLDVARILWDYHDLSPQNFGKLNLEDKAICAYFTNSLSKVAQEPNYTTNFKQYVQDIVANHLNAEASEWGEDYCFESKTTIYQNVPTKNKTVNINAVIVSLLLSV